MLIKEIKEILPFFKLDSWAEKVKLRNFLNVKKSNVDKINQTEIGLSYARQEIEILEQYLLDLQNFESFFNAKIDGKGKKGVQVYSQKLEEERLKFLELKRILRFYCKSPICFDNNKTFLLEMLERFKNKLNDLIKIYPLKVKAKADYLKSIIKYNKQIRDMSPNEFIYIEYVPPSKKPKPRNLTTELVEANDRVLNLIVTLIEIKDVTFKFSEFLHYYTKVSELESLTYTLDLEVNGNFLEIF